MKWIESMVGRNKSFAILIENWRCDYRNWLDQIYVHPEMALRIGMEVNLISTKIVAFVKMAQGKKKNPMRMADEFMDEELNAEEEVQNRLDRNLPESPLSDDVQNIHVANLHTLALQDRNKKGKDEKELNFWLFFQGISL
jgi:hypothetical protein